MTYYQMSAGSSIHTAQEHRRVWKDLLDLLFVLALVRELCACSLSPYRSAVTFPLVSLRTLTSFDFEELFLLVWTICGDSADVKILGKSRDIQGHGIKFVLSPNVLGSIPHNSYYL